MYLQYEEVAGFSTYHSNKSTRTVSLVFFLFGYSMPYTNRLANVKEGMLIRRGPFTVPGGGGQQLIQIVKLEW